jgi:hypothetical protein
MRHVACDARLGPAAGRKVRSLSHGLAWQLDWRDVSQKYFDRVQVGLSRRRLPRRTECCHNDTLQCSSRSAPQQCLRSKVLSPSARRCEAWAWAPTGKEAAQRCRVRHVLEKCLLTATST